MFKTAHAAALLAFADLLEESARGEHHEASEARDDRGHGEEAENGGHGLLVPAPLERVFVEGVGQLREGPAGQDDQQRDAGHEDRGALGGGEVEPEVGHGSGRFGFGLCAGLHAEDIPRNIGPEVFAANCTARSAFDLGAAFGGYTSVPRGPGAQHGRRDLHGLGKSRLSAALREVFGERHGSHC